MTRIDLLFVVALCVLAFIPAILAAERETHSLQVAFRRKR